jgi:hypothetical protein
MGYAIAIVTMKRNYIFKVWVSTIAAAPVLMMLATAIIAAKQGNGFGAGALTFIILANKWKYFLKR